jgi:hypothetical protein
VAKDHSILVVLESKPVGATEWHIRNNRISYDERVAFDVDKGLAEAQKQQTGWQAVEPDTQFRIVKVKQW